MRDVYDNISRHLWHPSVVVFLRASANQKAQTRRTCRFYRNETTLHFSASQTYSVIIGKKKFKFNKFLTRIERKLGDKSTLIWALMSAEWQIHRLFQTCYQTLGPISLIHSVVDLFMIGLKLISKTVYKLKFVFLGLNLAYFNLDEEASSIFVFCNFNLIFFWSTVYEGKKAKNKRWDKWGSFQ